MFGLRDEFTYLECRACGCLQILNPPGEMQRYYPPDYYAFRKRPAHSRGPAAWFRRLRAIYGLRAPDLFPRPGGDRFAVYPRFRKAGVNFRSRVLDVGSVTGLRLLEMANDGFTDLTGQDLFIPSDLTYENGVRILKRPLEAVEGVYDLIMLHHSLEHMSQPLHALETVRRPSSQNALVWVRIPVRAWAWRQYGMDWVGVDAPRHHFLHTEKSFRLLATQAGFEVIGLDYDSGALQFWGSERIRQNLLLMERTPDGFRSREYLFERREMRRFKRRARQLNRRRDGDTACFYLRPHA